MNEIEEKWMVSHDNPNMLVPHFLIASYCYYVHDENIISDAFYDGMCQLLLHHWNDINHPHKHLITHEDLACGSGFAIRYPNIVKASALNIMHSLDIKKNVRMADIFEEFKPEDYDDNGVLRNMR